MLQMVNLLSILPYTGNKWLSGCRGSSQRCSGLDSRWLPAFSLSSIQVRLITYKFIYFQHEACKMLWAFRVRKPLSIDSSLMKRIFQSTPDWVLIAQTEWQTEAFSTTCTVQYNILRIVGVVQLLWISGRALAAQARGVLGSTPGGCWLFHFPLFDLNLFKNLYTCTTSYI